MAEGFIARHQLWTAEQTEAAERLLHLDLRQVRIAWCDQHGILRGKTLESSHFATVLKQGKDFQTATLIFDTTNNPVVPPFSYAALGDPRMTGLPDGVLVPDPLTFRMLPWLDGTGWILSEMHYRTGERVPFDTRGVLADQLGRLSAEGYEYVSGAELEFYLTRMEDPMLGFEDSGYPPAPPRVTAVGHGFQYLTESRGDEIEPILSILRDNLVQLGLPLATVEDEWGPGQTEFTFDPLPGLATADAVVLARTAIKQLARRNGYHATFMARPALPNAFSSGWHLHQSLRSDESENVFAGGELLSETGLHFMGGLLKHALACSVLTTPTINGYKRYRPDSFAPDRIAWAEENRGALIRVTGGRGDANTHLENRVGDPAANPYLYLASQVAAGRDGLAQKLDPGPSADEPYAADAESLPATLSDAIGHFETSDLLRKEFGDPFVDYLTMIKKHEVARFNAAVTDWEQREYFEVY
ncbi:glutamine synthetase family protein [Cryptosporangium phraense]|uniref:Glutamine synthetase n=1 Tax=Cryptosporangium phraense TaxID=2593070 RepID=A0A545ANK8_9ACTN|nr:glutamine synthetase family protein [Cryptosporangium phraense]TQS42929.1 glutamine synthetase [Cryptosporangium phraense]